MGTLRDTTKVKTCVQKENTKIVLCECAKKDAKGNCVEKKMHKVCVKTDPKTKKCLEEKAQCVATCAKKVCEKKDKSGTCHSYKCIKRNERNQMKCIKYENIASHKCQQKGFSKKCSWVCVKRDCKGPHARDEQQKHKPKEKPTSVVKILDNKGHEYTEKELAALKEHDRKQFDTIVNALKKAEGQVASPEKVFEIKEAENKIQEAAGGKSKTSR